MTLPTIPTLRADASESLIEMYCEALMNRADKALMSGAASQGEYDSWVKALDSWATESTMRANARARITGGV